MSLPDLRFVYRDWDGPVRVPGFPVPQSCRRHRWTRIAWHVLRATKAAGLSSRPHWYVGPTDDWYCENCGAYRDQDAARQSRWHVWTVLDGLVQQLTEEEAA